MEIFLGIVVSLVSQISKKMFGTSEYATLATVVILSLLAAILYSTLSYVGYWGSVKEILMTAGAFYTFIISRFPNSSGPVKPSSV